MTAELLLISAMIALNSVLVVIAAKALFIPVKQKRKVYKRLCPQHSALNRKRGVWILDSKNCDLCPDNPDDVA